jgi:hypothetical protein
MFKKLGIQTFALAAIMAVAAPAVTFARDWDDYRGRGDEHQMVYRGSSGYDNREYDNREWNNQNRDRWNAGLGWYRSPAPVVRRYNGQGSYGQSYAGQYGARNSYNNNNDGARWR